MDRPADGCEVGEWYTIRGVGATRRDHDWAVEPFPIWGQAIDWRSAAGHHALTMDEFGGDVVPFHKYFPELAQAECRVATVSGLSDLPDDEYGLMEAYCDDASCDCRRVMLNVASREQSKILATVSFGFDPGDPMRGPFLDPLNEQSEYAPALLNLVRTVLRNSRYVARLERHYHLVKNAARKTKRS